MQAVSPDRKWRLVAAGGKIQLFGFEDGLPASPAMALDDELLAVRHSTSSSSVVLHGEEEDHVWNGPKPSGTENPSLVVVTMDSVTSSQSPDQIRIVFAGTGRVILIPGGATGATARIRCESPVRSAHFSPDGTQILAICADHIAVYPSFYHSAVDQHLRTEVETRSSFLSPDQSRILTHGNSMAQLWSHDGTKKSERPLPCLTGPEWSPFSARTAQGC